MRGRRTSASRSVNLESDLGAAAKYEREVVGGHGNDLGRLEARRAGGGLNVAEIAHAPARVLAAQPLVELQVALGRVLTVPLEGAVEEEDLARGQHARRALKQR